jgi:hypothetical protein
MRERTTGSGSIVVSVVGMMVVERRGMTDEGGELFREIHTVRGSGSSGGRITGGRRRIGAKWVWVVGKEGHGGGVVVVVVMRMVVMEGGEVECGSGRVGLMIGGGGGGVVVDDVVVVGLWVRQVETLLADLSLGLESG